MDAEGDELTEGAPEGGEVATVTSCSFRRNRDSFKQVPGETKDSRTRHIIVV